MLFDLASRVSGVSGWADASRDREIRLGHIEKRRLHRFSSKSELCEAESGNRCPADPAEGSEAAVLRLPSQQRSPRVVPARMHPKMHSSDNKPTRKYEWLGRRTETKVSLTTSQSLINARPISPIRQKLELLLWVRLEIPGQVFPQRWPERAQTLAHVLNTILFSRSVREDLSYRLPEWRKLDRNRARLGRFWAKSANSGQCWPKLRANWSISGQVWRML